MKSFQLLLSTASTLLHGVIGAPSPPGLSYLGTANASLAGPIMVGVGPLGPRIVFGITGGTFKGPSFSGMFPPHHLPRSPPPFPSWDEIDARGIESHHRQHWR